MGLGIKKWKCELHPVTPPSNLELSWLGDLNLYGKCFNQGQSNCNSEVGDETATWPLWAASAPEAINRKRGYSTWLEWLILLMKGKLGGCYQMWPRTAMSGTREIFWVSLVLPCSVAKVNWKQWHPLPHTKKGRTLRTQTLHEWLLH